MRFTVHQGFQVVELEEEDDDEEEEELLCEELLLDDDLHVVCQK
jgi:hypothetical protein